MKVVLQNLTKKFPGRGKNKTDEVIAVNDFTFEIPDGKLIGLLGPSGCGKSTCLNLICGLLRPTSGKIYFGEDDVTDLPPESRGVGMVFQNYALYPHLTVKQNIMFPLENLKGDKKMTKQAMEAKALEAAKLVQIDMLMDRKPGELSGGQQQRVAIARALVKTPRVLLLDEPLSNLDARLRLQTREEIRRIQTETGVTTIFVTHDQEEAMSISDLIFVMKLGVLQQIGMPQDVYDDPVNLVPGVKDQEVWAGIRPEGFILDEQGPLVCRFGAVEVMGRDISVVSYHDACQSPTVRSIIDADNHVLPLEGKVRFSVKPHKVHIFNKETEERIRF